MSVKLEEQSKKAGSRRKQAFDLRSTGPVDDTLIFVSLGGSQEDDETAQQPLDPRLREHNYMKKPSKKKNKENIPCEKPLPYWIEAHEISGNLYVEVEVESSEPETKIDVISQNDGAMVTVPSLSVVQIHKLPMSRAHSKLIDELIEKQSLEQTSNDSTTNLDEKSENFMDSDLAFPYKEETPRGGEDDRLESSTPPWSLSDIEELIDLESKGSDEGSSKYQQDEQTDRTAEDSDEGSSKHQQDEQTDRTAEDSDEDSFQEQDDELDESLDMDDSDEGSFQEQDDELDESLDMDDSDEDSFHEQDDELDESLDMDDSDEGSFQEQDDELDESLDMDDSDEDASQDQKYEQIESVDITESLDIEDPEEVVFQHQQEEQNEPFDVPKIKSFGAATPSLIIPLHSGQSHVYARASQHFPDPSTGIVKESLLPGEKSCPIMMRYGSFGETAPFLVCPPNITVSFPKK